jgi:putative DNA primase/helicase
MNDKPRITDTSNAIWRRLQLIPFNRTFPKHEQDTRLTFKLLEELPGILNWALWGLVDLRQTNHFMAVQAVELAKQAYRRESNPVQQWAEERTNVTEMPLTKAGVLFDDFIQWLDANGHPKHMFNSTQFGLELKRLKYLCKRIPQGVRYFLALKPYQQEM